jgi:hypothetical protein
MAHQEFCVTEKVVIDRFDGNLAVLTVGEGEAARTVNVPKKALPKRAKEGIWLQVKLDGERVVSATVDEEETARARQRIMEKLDRLRRGRAFGVGPTGPLQSTLGSHNNRAANRRR